MAIHSELPIDKAAHDLYICVITLARNFPSDVKHIMGAPLQDLCLSIRSLIYLTNKAADKQARLQCLDEMLLRQVQVESIIETARDMRFITPAQYGQALKHTSLVGRQANGWRRKYVPTPAP